MGGWRSSCRESGAQCVAMVLELQRVMLPAGNWDILLLVALAILVNLGKKFIVSSIVKATVLSPPIASHLQASPLGYGLMMWTAALVLQPCSPAVTAALGLTTVATLKMWL